MIPSRRGLLGGAGLLGLAAAGPGVAAGPAAAEATALQATLERYFGFGAKASGGPGDEACGAWLEGELARNGYACRRQSFEIPFFEVRQASLTCGAAKASVIPQAIVAPTGPQGLTAPLKLASTPGDLSGSIALVVLPYKRWIGIGDPQASRPLADAVARGAAGVLLVTTGPTGEAIALNVSTKRPSVDRPVALLAPKDAQPFLAAAAEGKTATLIVDGRGGRTKRRSAYNLIARLDRKAAKTLVISTPRSGWFGCAAERGSGLAVWLSLAGWLARTHPAVNVELVATSGHEYQYLGGELFLEHEATKPDATAMWLHIGASAACRDWHELGRLLPLPSADAQRVLTASAQFLHMTRQAFHGISGLEATYLADRAMAGGELGNVIAAGHKNAMGLYGVHRFFHTQADDMRCTSGELVAPLIAAFRTALTAALKFPMPS
ncbi:MAG TPA: hypothetical protein VHW05_03650 [Phenylobacterium sp.]|jgi:hypothetical protein|nr:hypothetical protein [Phenylobacterium sp.]